MEPTTLVQTTPFTAVGSPAVESLAQKFSTHLEPVEEVLKTFREHDTADEKQATLLRQNLDLIQEDLNRPGLRGAAKSRHTNGQRFLTYIHEQLGADACIAFCYSHSMTALLGFKSFLNSSPDNETYFAAWWNNVQLPTRFQSQSQIIQAENSSVFKPDKGTLKRSWEEAEPQGSLHADQRTRKRIAVDDEKREHRQEETVATGTNRNLKEPGTYWSGNIADEVKLGPVYSISLRDAILALVDSDAQVTLIFPNSSSKQPVCTFEVREGTGMKIARNSNRLC
ncbi:hypothetical protein B0J13DRAFT_568295 [Dactylonectria estremocensis]|uniref:Uncharacterized protein n=1 Tax=Dactylonectria estremocensis TaxID=1079267 RepID=A0A9P9DKA5_9HYPO|nr:hypothetical protein B0J13DRAFT_579646 [Dactylonectria estremocensis]KAH7120131.1 hypothetical protein B0J13DRAFT_568295 [Dactylonectria estremocensis]